MQTFDWEQSTLNKVYDCGNHYLYALIRDYENYIKDYDKYIPLETFLERWTCISPEGFKLLQKGDNVYDYSGMKYTIQNFYYDNDFETMMVNVEGCYGEKRIFCNGDLYGAPYIHYDYSSWEKIKQKESEEQLCPILITKTNQPQN